MNFLSEARYAVFMYTVPMHQTPYLLMSSLTDFVQQRGEIYMRSGTDIYYFDFNVFAMNMFL
jgi:hypothetical protein